MEVLERERIVAGARKASRSLMLAKEGAEWEFGTPAVNGGHDSRARDVSRRTGAGKNEGTRVERGQARLGPQRPGPLAAPSARAQSPGALGRAATAEAGATEGRG